jgi:hypothetical protein
VSNALYPKYKQSVLSGDANSDLLQTSATTAPFLALVNTSSYTYSSTHQFYSSLSGVVGTDQQLTTPTTTNGTFDADDVTYTAVTGSTVGALVVYRKNAGANTTWRLVMYEDTSVTGLPVTPNGGNIVVTWNASGIFLISSKSHKVSIVQVDKMGPLGVYEFSYVGDNPSRRYRGFMANEVKAYAPEAVQAFDGIDHVDYQRAITQLHL